MKKLIAWSRQVNSYEVVIPRILVKNKAQKYFRLVLLLCIGSGFYFLN
jgi:hypothetical protein